MKDNFFLLRNVDVEKVIRVQSMVLAMIVVTYTTFSYSNFLTFKSALPA